MPYKRSACRWWALQLWFLSALVLKLFFLSHSLYLPQGAWTAPLTCIAAMLSKGNRCVCIWPEEAQWVWVDTNNSLKMMGVIIGGGRGVKVSLLLHKMTWLGRTVKATERSQEVSKSQVPAGCASSRSEFISWPQVVMSWCEVCAWSSDWEWTVDVKQFQRADWILEKTSNRVAKVAAKGIPEGTVFTSRLTLPKRCESQRGAF